MCLVGDSGHWAARNALGLTLHGGVDLGTIFRHVTAHTGPAAGSAAPAADGACCNQKVIIVYDMLTISLAALLFYYCAT